ncbi:MAG: hypothetical protein ISR85_00120 [Kiritimatiellales bacterium]|nr:hypothetical protein [Kiritimatiellota bacterium]MBL7011317.1 hypothetical protein [Kiritimatiellales bacterium]
MKKIPAILEELLIWIRGRFSLTGEEKLWLLIFLIICWTGLLGRYVYLKNQQPELLTPQQMEHLLNP